MLCTVWGVISCLHETFVVLLSFCMHCVLKDMGIANLPLVDVFFEKSQQQGTQADVIQFFRFI